MNFDVLKLNCIICGYRTVWYPLRFCLRFTLTWPCEESLSRRGPESLEEGLAESLDFTLWSAQRALKALEQISVIMKQRWGGWRGSTRD